MIAAAILIATFTSSNPATLRDCEYRTGVPNATLVLNVSSWNRHGWPFWRVTCYWRST